MNTSHDILTRLPLFEGIDAEEAQRIVRMLKPKRFEPGEILITQGQWQGELYILNSGLVSVTVADPQGRSVEVARLGRGECIGEMSLLTGQLPTATVTAFEQTDALVLGHRDFMTLVGSNAVLSRNMGRVLSERLSHIDDRYVSEHEAQMVALYDLSSKADGGAVGFNIAVSLAHQTRSRVLYVETTGEEGTVAPCTPELGTLADIFEDRGLLDRHKDAVDCDDRLCGLRAMRLSSSGQTGGGDSSDLRAALALLGPIYDYILVHVPAEADPLSQSVAERADLILVLLPYEELGRADARLARLQTAPDAVERTRLVVIEAPDGAAVTGESAHATGWPWRMEAALPSDSGMVGSRDGRPFVLTSPTASLTKEINRLARRIAGISVGLALGAGGAKGLAHLGVLQVLEEEGVPIDCVAGCSFGAFIGALYAMGFNSAQLSELVPAILTPSALTSFFRSALLRFSFTSLLGGKGVEKGLQDVFGETDFRHLRIPFAAVAVDLNSGAEVVLTEGPLYLAVRASVAMPGVFPPLQLGDRYLVDGGVLNPLPTRTAAALGANVVIGVDVSNPEPRPELPEGCDEAVSDRRHITGRNVISILRRVVDVMQTDISRRSAAKADILITPRFAPFTWHDFRRREVLVRAGEEAAREALPSLGAYLPWLARGGPGPVPSATRA